MNETDAVTGRVTVVVSRVVKQGREAEYEQWLAGIHERMSAFEGFAGLELVRPVDGLQPEHVVILSFHAPEHLRRWEASEIRKTWLAKADPFTDRPVNIQHISGMEGLFTLGRSDVALAPPKYKMVIVVAAALYPLVVLSNQFVAPYLPLPFLGRMLVTTVLNTAIMTYLVMPQLTWLLRSWLAATPARRGVAA
jgi:antibiotic biosynthesis monooxygenase (ABM) superfamily enzyme